jgi:hypothetical protein
MKSTSSEPGQIAAANYLDPVIEAYKKDVDRTLLRENLKLSVEERFQKFERFMEYVSELRQAGALGRGTDARDLNFAKFCELEALLEERPEE